MAAYYYLAASLPMISSPDQDVPIDSEEILDTSSRFMKKAHFESFRRTSLDPETGSTAGICGQFLSWERSLRNELVRLRAAEQGLNGEPYLREGDDVFGTAAVASEAMAKSTPLEAEQFLDASRWQKIEELESGHFFDIDFLRAYMLKLKILERRALFDEEKGFAAYRDLYARVFEASGAEVPVGGVKA